MPIPQSRILELKHEALLARTRRRQKAAKAALVRRGVAPRVDIGSNYVPPIVARAYLHANVSGVRRE